MTGEIRNPAKLSTDLNPAEKEFARCLQLGKICNLGGKNPPRPLRQSPDVNVIRAEKIREFIIGKDAIPRPADTPIWICGAWITGDLIMDFASITAPLYFRNCHFDSAVSMAYAECPSIIMDGSRLCKGAVLDGIRIRGILSMRSHSYGCFVSQDRVILVGARIDGDLTCRGGHFSSDCGIAIVAERARIGGNVFLSGIREIAKRFIANGDVRLNGSKIEGDVDCSYGSFQAGKECALILVNADIQGNVQCTNSQFLVQDKKSFGGDRMRVGGECCIGKGFLAGGITQLNGARIDGDLNCSEGVFNGGLSAENVIVVGSVFLRKITGRGVATFSSAKAGTLVDDDGLWRPFEVILDGFQYAKLVGDGTPTDPASRIKWLKRRPQRLPFSPLPYEQAAKVLRAMGKDIDAWDIEREKRRLERAEQHPGNAFKISGWRPLWGQTIDALTDFVYRPWKTIRWAIAIVCVSALLFNFANKSGRIVPHQPIVVTDSGYKMRVFPRCVEFQCPPERRPTNVVQCLFPDYPEFNALVYSVDVFIPFFALHQEPYWYPNPSDADQEILLRILLVWYWLEIIAGWILTSLFLLSVTGLLRPRQSSGERD